MEGTYQLRTRSLNEEQPMQASKWLKCQALLEVEEMAKLLDHLSEQQPLYIFLTGCITKPGKGLVSKQEFLDGYSRYIESLKSGLIPKNEDYRTLFSTIFTLDPAMLYSVLVGPDQQLIRVAKPVIQLQAHSLDYSPVDGKFRPMILGTESILWGIQFSYPQIFQNNETKEVEEITVSSSFPNTAAFRALQKWMRLNTIPTPFLVEQKTINVPMRLGKQCLSWVNNHPQLIKKNLKIKSA